MRQEISLGVRLDQRMTLAPRMIQSMEILQMSVLALQERIDQELNENPVLEIQQTKPEDATEVEGEEAVDPHVKADDPEKELVIDVDGGQEQDFDRLEAINEDWSDHFNEEHRPSANRIQEHMDKKHDAMMNMASRPPSLVDHLEDQLHYLVATPEQQELVSELISHLDKRGYLKTPLEELVHTFVPPVSLQELEEALIKLQSFDPPGVGARDLRECLLLQISKDTPHAEVIRELILHHLQDIKDNRLPNIQKHTGFALSEIQEAIEELRHFNPSPGSEFDEESVPYVVPDLAIEQNEFGEYEVRLLDDWTPDLKISRRYWKLLRDKNLDASTRKFVKAKIQSANWLIDAIEQRRNTLIRVTQSIVEKQRAFLDSGPEYIEPLKMQQIAEQVGVHVTTVSRAIQGKYVQTPRGVYSLKRFFGGGTHTATGEEVAYEKIKKKLKEIVDHEDKSDPYSDEDLVTKLQQAGLPVARRTVTKYRKMLDIPSSRQRKIWN